MTHRTFLWMIPVLAILILAVVLPHISDAACAAGAKCLENPLRFPTIEAFIEGLLKAVVAIALPIITVFTVYAGFKYILARGNPGKIGEAHKNFLFVLIGASLILGAWVLATLIGGTVTDLLGNG